MSIFLEGSFGWSQSSTQKMPRTQVHQQYHNASNFARGRFTVYLDVDFLITLILYVGFGIKRKAEEHEEDQMVNADTYHKT